MSVGSDQIQNGVPTRRRIQYVLSLEVIAVAAVVISLIMLAFLPGALGYSMLMVSGGSMEPSVPAGSIAVVSSVPISAIEVDDIIVRPATGVGPSVIHRVIAVREQDDQRVFTLKGDANPRPDVDEVTLRGRASRHEFAVPIAGYLFAFGQKYRLPLLAFCVAGYAIRLQSICSKRMWPTARV